MSIEKKNSEKNKNLEENKIKIINSNYLKNNQKNTEKVKDKVNTVLVDKINHDRLKVLAEKLNIPIDKLYEKLVDNWREHPYIAAFLLFFLGGLGAIAAVAAIIASEELPEYPKNTIEKTSFKDFVNDSYSDPSHGLNFKTSNPEISDPETSDSETKKINDNKKTFILPKNTDNRIIRRGFWDQNSKTNSLDPANSPQPPELRQRIPSFPVSPSSPNLTETTIGVSRQSTPGSSSLPPELNESGNQTADRVDQTSNSGRFPLMDEFDPDAMSEAFNASNALEDNIE